MVRFNDESEIIYKSYKEFFEEEIEILREMLSEGIVEVTFLKVDGTRRIIHATTQASLIPKTNVSGDYQIDDRYTRIFDMEDKSWKTFINENVIMFGWSGKTFVV